MDQIGSSSDPGAILQRLEELRRWQDEQQSQLVQKQITQREQLALEQQKLYEMFGLSAASLSSTFANDEKDAVSAAGGTITKFDQSRNELIRNLSTLHIDENDAVGDEPAPIPKRAFLKRGAGLEKRFGVHPDVMRIGNLPKYKYADSRRQSKFYRAAAKNSAHTARVPQKSVIAEDKNLILSQTMDERIRQQQAEIDRLGSNERRPNVETASTTPAPFHQVQTFDQHETDESIDEYRVLPASPVKQPQVRFQPQVQLVTATTATTTTDVSDTESISSSAEHADDIEQTSTPNTNRAFRAFKSKLFRTDQRTKPNVNDADESTIIGYESDVSQIPDAVTSQSIHPTTIGGIVDQTAALELKLQQLEHEISVFRTKNAALTAVAQQQQLERVALAEERAHIEQQLLDERAAADRRLHDERKLLAVERDQLEQRLRQSRGPNRKEREETAALKERVDQLERESVAKEQRHVAAQARLRAQLRTMEKDLKDFSYEIDQLRKGNKKLEDENVKLRRQSNSKMLTEINRNIARLSDKVKEPEMKPTAAAQVRTSKTPESSKSSTNRSAATSTNRLPLRQRTQSVPNLARIHREVAAVTVATSSPSASASDDEAAVDVDVEQSHYFRPDPPAVLTPRDRLRSKDTERKDTTDQAVDTSEMLSSQVRREIVNRDGSREILYPNGNLKIISSDAMCVRMLYFNKDIKETSVAGGTVKYYYAQTNTWQTSYLDGLEIFEFPNGQIEHRHRDGKIEVHFPNGSVRISDPGNAAVLEEWRYADGSRVENRRSGERILALPNGQREVHTAQHKRREYPDGTVKLVYPDGSQETRYSNGRVRLKDRDGKLVMDSENMFAVTTTATKPKASTTTIAS